MGSKGTVIDQQSRVPRPISRLHRRIRSRARTQQLFWPISDAKAMLISSGASLDVRRFRSISVVSHIEICLLGWRTRHERAVVEQSFNDNSTTQDASARPPTHATGLSMRLAMVVSLILRVSQPVDVKGTAG
jgi:hypothetical protein